MQKWVHVTLSDGKVITATEGHPFRTVEGWRDAVLLKKGDILTLTGSDGKPSTIQIDGVRYETKVLTTYNLEVANAHTFFVGEDAVLVHNSGCDIRLPVSGASDILSKGPHLHTSYGEVVLEGVPGTGKLKVDLFGKGNLPKAVKQIKENWGNSEFRRAFRERLVDMKANLATYTKDQRLIKNTTANIDAGIKATKSTKFPEFVE